MSESRPLTADLECTPQVFPFFDDDTSTFSYVVRDPASDACAVVDAVLRYDPASGRTDAAGADALVALIRQRGWSLQWIIETHVHADHLSAAPYIQRQLGGRIGIGAEITQVQEIFAPIFNAGPNFSRDGSQFDHLFADGETYRVGEVVCRALHTPGHTPACMTHLMGEAAFVGDTLFMPDAGTARADFPGGDARTLYRSIQRVLALPEDIRLYMCHDYRPNDRPLAWQTTVAEQRVDNIHVGAGADEEGFVALREKRDAGLGMPRLILPSLQVNMRAGYLPPAEDNGTVYLKIPVDLL